MFSVLAIWLHQRTTSVAVHVAGYLFVQLSAVIAGLATDNIRFLLPAQPCQHYQGLLPLLPPFAAADCCVVHNLGQNKSLEVVGSGSR